MSEAVQLNVIWAQQRPHTPGQSDGVPLKTIDGISAYSAHRLHTGDDGETCPIVEVTAWLDEIALSVSESRWLFGRLIDHLGGLYQIDGVVLRREDSETDSETESAVYRALALDLISRYPTTRVHGITHDEERLRELSCLEAGYRGWVDEDPTTRTSGQIAADVLSFADAHDGVEAFVLEGDELEQENLNLLRAVGGASKLSPPRLVVATYGDPTLDTAPLMLVGKGITFDSGGINVKPYESFVSMMKNDMGGAALAWHLFKGLVASDFPQPLVVAIPTCENPVGEDAMRPGSVVTGHRGVSVRIDHTDAEGRLILADALSWASERYQPTEIITFATLTTAALRSYGPLATPIHFAAPELEASLREASDRCGEDVHFFPQRVWHREANRDHEAQVRNTGRLAGHASIGAGSRNAAHFLRFFTDAPLTHLDIFASTWDWSGQGPAGSRHGATGSPFRTLLTGLRAYGDR